MPTTEWHALHPLWQAGEEVIQLGLPHQQLAPPWQMLLLGDGSPTRHMQLLTGESIEVDVIDMSLIGESSDGAPEPISALSGALLRRQVWLRTASGQRTAYVAFFQLEARKLVGTDIFQAAILLTFTAIGHLSLGTVDWNLVIPIWIGSVPGVLIGAKLCQIAPQRALRFVVYALLVMVSWKLVHAV